MRKNIVFICLLACISLAFLQKPVQPKEDNNVNNSDTPKQEIQDKSSDPKGKQVIYSLPDSGAVVVNTPKTNKAGVILATQPVSFR